MVRRSIEILKVRWPEAMLIVVFQAALMVLMNETGMSFDESATQITTRAPFWADFFLGFGGVLCVIVWTMLYLGFLKTAATRGVYPQRPIDLLRWGRLYFWKIFLFQILLTLVLWVFLVVSFFVGMILWRTQDAATIPEWYILVCMLVFVVLLMKAALFIPARIIVYDESVFSSVKVLGSYRLGDVEHLYVLIGGLVGFAVLSGVFFRLVPEQSVLYYVVSGISYPILSFLWVWLTLAVVLWLQRELETQQTLKIQEQTQE